MPLIYIDCSIFLILYSCVHLNLASLSFFLYFQEFLPPALFFSLIFREFQGSWFLPFSMLITIPILSLTALLTNTQNNKAGQRPSTLNLSATQAALQVSYLPVLQSLPFCFDPMLKVDFILLKNREFDCVNWGPTGWPSLQTSFLPEGFVKMLTEKFLMNSHNKTLFSLGVLKKQKPVVSANL